MNKKEPNYQTNIFVRYAVRQQHISIFIGYVFGRYEEDLSVGEDYKTVKAYAVDFIRKFDLDIDPVILYNSYMVSIQVFKECLKAERKIK